MNRRRPSMAITRMMPNMDAPASLYRGRQMEQGPTEQVLRVPAADYTRRLLAALPRRARGSLANATVAVSA
jgi:ABC-type dipeptide/oligopeptide/nickel transport system ATPase component